jgi:hypothetical protein
VGRGHASLLTNLDTRHSEPFTDMWCVGQRKGAHRRQPLVRVRAELGEQLARRRAVLSWR